MEDYMPILGEESRLPTCPKEVPMSMLSGIVAYQNHGQSLARLKERGGLSVRESLAIILDKPWDKVKKIPSDAAITCLTILIQIHQAMTKEG